MTVGLGACKKVNESGAFQKANLRDLYDDGTNHSVLYSNMLTMDFQGASGHVKYVLSTGSRDAETIPTVVYNAQPNDGGGARVLATGGVASSAVSVKLSGAPWTRQWQGKSFVYANGGTALSAQIYPPTVNMNFLPIEFALVAWILMGLTQLAFFGILVWIVKFRNDEVRASFDEGQEERGNCAPSVRDVSPSLLTSLSFIPFLSSPPP